MITKSSVTKEFNGNAQFGDMAPEFTVKVDVEFDSDREATDCVEEIEAILLKFPRKMSKVKSSHG
jgi:hypothetical protein